MEKYETSQEFYERAISLYRSEGWARSGVYVCQTAIALAKAMNKEKDIRINEIFECYEKNKMKMCEGFMLNNIGEILLNIDDQHISEAEDWIKRAIEANQKYGMMWNLAQDYALYAEWFKRKGDLPKAKENLSKAIEVFKGCGADGWVEKYEKELASFS